MSLKRRTPTTLASSLLWSMTAPSRTTLSTMITLPSVVSFIDHSKYFEWSMKLTTEGSVIIVDNVVRDGAVIDHNSDDASVVGVRRFNDMLANDSRVTATTIQTVGSKGYDGFTIALR